MPQQWLGHARLLGIGKISRRRRGVFGCSWKTVTKEQVRKQAFEEWARESERQSELDRERREREDARQRELERSARKRHW